MTYQCVAAEEKGFLMCVGINLNKQYWVIVCCLLVMFGQRGYADQDVGDIQFNDIIDSIYQADQLQQDSLVEDLARDLNASSIEQEYPQFELNYQALPMTPKISKDPKLGSSTLWQSQKLNPQPNMSATGVFKVLRRTGMVATCIRFVNQKNYGAWALDVKKAFEKFRFNYLLKGTRDLTKVCPKYRSMKESEKIDVWITVIIAMSHYESSCRPQVTAKGPNGPLLGLLQLHRGKEGRYSKICDNGDGKSVSATIDCGLSMLDDQLRRDSQLFSQKSYWDVLRPRSPSQKWRKIASSISFYPSCH